MKQSPRSSIYLIKDPIQLKCIDNSQTRGTQRKLLLFPYEYDLLGVNPNTYQSCIIMHSQNHNLAAFMMSTKCSFLNSRFSIDQKARMSFNNQQKWVSSSNQYLVLMQQLLKSLWLHKQQEMSTLKKKLCLIVVSTKYPIRILVYIMVVLFCLPKKTCTLDYGHWVVLSSSMRLEVTSASCYIPVLMFTQQV